MDDIIILRLYTLYLMFEISRILWLTFIGCFVIDFGLFRVLQNYVDDSCSVYMAFKLFHFHTYNLQVM